MMEKAHLSDRSMAYGGKNQPGKGKYQGKGGGKQGGKDDGKQKGKKGDGFFQRPIQAHSLEDAMARMQRFMERNPDYVFQPKPGLRDVYVYLGEDGEQLYKNMKQGLQSDEAASMMPRILQFMGQSSTWKADELNWKE